MSKRGRPGTKRQGEALNLWMEKAVKRKIYKLADEQNISQSSLIERLIEAAWLTRCEEATK